MISSLLHPHPIPKVSETPKDNSINGTEAESFAMSRVLLACRGEGYWGSRAEDNSKIDLLFSAPHPWINNERMLILSQVKSGPAYGKETEKGYVLNRLAKISAIRTTHDICVVWVERKSSKAYWAYLHPGSLRKDQIYGVQHEVSPAMIYDLARCMAQSNIGAVGGAGIIIKDREGTNLKIRRQFIKGIYKGLAEIVSPVLGGIIFTDLAWRHMFRQSRGLNNKSASLNIIPYLAKILTQYPTTHSITDVKFFQRAGFVYRRCEYLLKYNRVSISEPGSEVEKVVAHVRLVEEIRFPAKWAELAMLTQLVDRRVVLKSAYYKHD